MMFFLATHVGRVDLISLTFPVRGHSFLPANRVFGQAEKHLRKNPTIIDKSKYYEQYEKVGTFHRLGHDWELFDVKCLGKVLKSLSHISDMKRIIMKTSIKSEHTAIKVEGYKFYRFEGNGKKYSLLKKRCKWANIIHTPLENIPLVHTISSAKKKDVTKLLVALFDKDWKDNEALSWYLSVYFDNPDTGRRTRFYCRV